MKSFKSSKKTVLIIRGMCLAAMFCVSAVSQRVLAQRTHQDSLRTELLDLMKVPERGKLDFTIKPIAEEIDYTLYRVVIFPSPGDSIPCYFLKPSKVKPPYPAMICLQGHAPGMYISIGAARNEKDEKMIAGGRDIALQAVAHGWAALTVEQRGFGEQQVGELSCNHLSLNGAMQGKPMIGQRVSDISCAIDFFETQAGCSER